MNKKFKKMPVSANSFSEAYRKLKRSGVQVIKSGKSVSKGEYIFEVMV